MPHLYRIPHLYKYRISSISTRSLLALPLYVIRHMQSQAIPDVAAFRLTLV
jgi:hypothetical protein